MRHQDFSTSPRLSLSELRHSWDALTKVHNKNIICEKVLPALDNIFLQPVKAASAAFFSEYKVWNIIILAPTPSEIKLDIEAGSGSVTR